MATICFAASRRFPSSSGEGSERLCAIPPARGDTALEVAMLVLPETGSTSAPHVPTRRDALDQPAAVMRQCLISINPEYSWDVIAVKGEAEMDCTTYHYDQARSGWFK